MRYIYLYINVLQLDSLKLKMAVNNKSFEEIPDRSGKVKISLKLSTKVNAL